MRSQHSRCATFRIPSAGAASCTRLRAQPRASALALCRVLCIQARPCHCPRILPSVRSHLAARLTRLTGLVKWAYMGITFDGLAPLPKSPPLELPPSALLLHSAAPILRRRPSRRLLGVRVRRRRLGGADAQLGQQLRGRLRDALGRYRVRGA